MCKKIVAVVMCCSILMCTIVNGFADNTVSVSLPTVTPEGELAIAIDGNVLVKDKDYTLTYRDNTKVGKAMVTVTFIGNYKGEREVSFNIVKKKSSHSNRKENTTVKIMEDDNLIMTTETNGDVRVDLNQNIKVNSVYKAYVTLYGMPQINKYVEIIDDKGRTLRGKTDSKGIAYLSVVATPTATPVSGSSVTPTPEIHKAYIFGYENGTFRPDNTITRAETVSMLNSVLDVKTGDKNLSFSDIESSAWYAPVIKKMAAEGIINGYTDGTFRPDNQITRAEFVTMLMKSKSIQKFEKLPFPDVDKELWSADYIYSAYMSEYIDGYADGTFKPDNPITRAEAVKIINAVQKRTDFKVTNNPFVDLKESHWAYSQILEAAVEHTK